MKPPTKSLSKKERGIELRRTHFCLGNDDPNYLSEYQKDYLKWGPLSQKGPLMDNVTLRRSHFNLGLDQNDYETSSMEQSKELFSQKNIPALLDQNMKNDLRSSHFIFGNDPSIYQTQNKLDFTDKSKQNAKDVIDFKGIERRLRATNYELGTEKPDYISEAADKFRKPSMSTKDIFNNKISTSELQRSHYVFGNEQMPWVTTSKLHYGPKLAENVEPIRDTKTLTKTNFILGTDEPTTKSINQETYTRLPYSKNEIDQNLKNDLRRHHFVFGSDGDTNITSLYNQKFQNPYTFQNYEPSKKLDPKFLKETHWTMGDPSKDPKEHYYSAYRIAMTPKKPSYNPIVESNTFQSSFKITGSQPSSYQTENRSNFTGMSNNVSQEEIQNMKDVMHNIRSSHFELGDTVNDYTTVNNISYKYDPKLASGAKGKLDRALINDLRATHYKLGYDDIEKTTSQRRDYVAYNILPTRGKDPLLRKSHFSLGKEQQPLDGKSMYMVDYYPKVLPKDDEC